MSVMQVSDFGNVNLADIERGPSGDIPGIRAVLTSNWGNKGYRPISVSSIESFYIDTALDVDADTWSIDIGDPNGDLIDLLEPDNEVRVQLFAVGRGVDFLNTGFADEISYTDAGVITMTGRDISAVAADTIAMPKEYRHYKAHDIVAERARTIGIGKKLNLAPAKTYKRQYTDGSETEWEFWYRLYRKEQMWLWATPDGTLTAGFLNYKAAPVYYFGHAAGEQANIDPRLADIGITHYEVNKSTQARVGTVWGFGETRYHNYLMYKEEDKTTRNWIKRPVKFVSTKESASPSTLKREVADEVHDSRVGAIEIRVTIVDPGFPIRTNQNAILSIPEIGEVGGSSEYFIVGVRAQGGPGGIIQEVRLRQKDFALTNRVPPDPKPEEKVSREDQSTITDTIALPGHPEWMDYFVRTANEFQGGWGFSLFLATLMAQCEVETNFRNVRENGGPGGDGIEWYPIPDGGAESPGGPGREGGGSRELWRQRFANEPGGGYVSKEFGVGPMQLTDPSLKDRADDYMRRGYHDEWQGGRWHPQHNIRTGGWYLNQVLRGLPQTNKNNIWIGVGRYNGGTNYSSKPISLNYVQRVRALVEGKYLPSIKSAIAAARDQTDPQGISDDVADDSFPNAQQAIAIVYSVRPNSPEESKRKAIVAAAMYGHYYRSLISYSHLRPLRDMSPPPNIPNQADCSSFAIWCYRCGDAPDPTGRDYSGYGFTGDMMTHGRGISIAQMQPGDLVLYGNPMSESGHVAIYVGNGKVVSHGSSPGPNLVAYNYRPVVAVRSYL